MSCRVTLLDTYAERLRDLVLPATGEEGAAYGLFRVAEYEDAWSGVPVNRFLLREVIPIAPDDVVSRSADHIRTRTRTFAQVLRRAAETGCVPAFIHGHPGGYDRFSVQDDADEPALIEMAQNRNGRDARLLSIVFTGNQKIFGRVWIAPDASLSIDSVIVVGETFEIHGETGHTEDEAFHRQALAFGPAFTLALGQLRIGIVGGGATGSAVATLLARLGARRLLLIDNDTVETTNLSRLHGATRSDVGRLKTEVLRDHLLAMGLNADVRLFDGWVGAARGVITACDLVFGCTDDHDGRLFLNRLAYFYLTPVFDVGIGIDTDDHRRITHAESRITVVSPGSRCLLCRGVVDQTRAREDDLLRSDPEEYARLRAEGEAYIRGGGLHNPAVVTFTTGVACLVVDELTQRLTGYRRSGSIPHRVIKHHIVEDKRPGPRDRPCTICRDGQYWGLGDVQPFLDRVG